MSTRRWPHNAAARGLALAVVVFGLGACRSKVGDACRCASDCGAGLDCFAEGEKVLMGDACFKPGVIGTCVVAESIDTDSNGEPLDPVPVRDDLPSKRDLAGPGGSDSDSATTGTATTSMTGTTDVTTTSTSTTTTTTGDTTTTTGDTTTTTGTSTDSTTTGTSTGTTTTGTSTGTTTGTTTGDSSSSGSSSG